MTVIYALVDRSNSEVRYVGKTSQIQKRLPTHKRDLSDSYRGRWLRSIEYDIDIIVVEESPEDWVEAERFWIAYFNYLGARLTNTTIGGEGLVNPSQSVRDAIARARLGTSHAPESLAKISISLIGNSYALGFKHSQETRDKISKGGMGRTASAETRIKMSTWQKGAKPSEQCINAVKDANARRVFTEEDRRIKSENMKRIWADRKAKKELE